MEEKINVCAELWRKRACSFLYVILHNGVCCSFLSKTSAKKMYLRLMLRMKGKCRSVICWRKQWHSG